MRLGQKRREAKPHKNENWHRGVGLEQSIHLQYFSLLSAYSLQRYQLFCEKKRARERKRGGGRERKRERGGEGEGDVYVYYITFF